MGTIKVFFAGNVNLNRSYNVIYEQMAAYDSAILDVLDVSLLTFDYIRQQASEAELLVLDNSLWFAQIYDPKRLDSTILSNWRGREFYEDVFQSLTRSMCRKLYVASGWDLHWPGPNLDDLLPCIDGIAWLYEKKPVTVKELPEHYIDSWMKQHIDPLANWHKVRAMVPVRIELIHSLAPYEISAAPARNYWDTCVLGVSYLTRQIAIKSSAEQGLRIAPSTLIDNHILGMTERLPGLLGAVRTSRLRNRSRQLMQNVFARRSFVNFVCGSGLKYPVRKFFEIPAALSAMIAYPCTGFSDFGFKDGENVVVSTPEGFGKAARLLMNNSRLRDRIRKNAWQLIQEQHSVRKRVDDLIQCMQFLRRGELGSAQFVNGRFEITQL